MLHIVSLKELSHYKLHQNIIIIIIIIFYFFQLGLFVSMENYGTILMKRDGRKEPNPNQNRSGSVRQDRCIQNV